VPAQSVKKGSKAKNEDWTRRRRKTRNKKPNTSGGRGGKGRSERLEFKGGFNERERGAVAGPVDQLPKTKHVLMWRERQKCSCTRYGGYGEKESDQVKNTPTRKPKGGGTAALVANRGERWRLEKSRKWCLQPEE